MAHAWLFWPSTAPASAPQACGGRPQGKSARQAQGHAGPPRWPPNQDQTAHGRWCQHAPNPARACGGAGFEFPSAGPVRTRAHGHKAAMSRRVDIARFDGEIERGGMAPCHITAISPSGTAGHITCSGLRELAMPAQIPRSHGAISPPFLIASIGRFHPCCWLIVVSLIGGHYHRYI